MKKDDFINREDAKKKHCEICMEECVCYRDKSRCNELKAFDTIPAADVRPVVRGEWEDVEVRDYSTNINGGMPLSIASMFCPVCGRWHNEVYHYGNPTEMVHYCPNCGADMREEQT